MKHFWVFLLTLVLSAVVPLPNIAREFSLLSDLEMGMLANLKSVELTNSNVIERVVERVINLTSKESNDSNTVEVDGIRLEILVPDQVWYIPEKQPNATTPVRIGLQIKNKTPYPIRFPPFDPLMVLPLEIVEPDGKFLQRQAARDILLKSPQLTCPLIQPRESVTFFLNAQLFWNNNKLVLGGTDGLGGGWHFNNLKPGNYQIRFRYISSRGVLLCYDSKRNEDKLIQGIWTGQITTPFVKFRLVES